MIDFQHCVEYALSIYILHGHFVKGPTAAEVSPVGTMNTDRERHTVFHTPAVIDDKLKRLGEGLLLPFSQETNVAKVDPQNG